MVNFAFSPAKNDVETELSVQSYVDICVFDRIQKIFPGHPGPTLRA